ncbi:endonuclease [[Mycoplasma] gypis]|uniref:Endonuclease n=1 Tax=[Mycoplasma] gypis TaxID=92404 RepID=A0ABZ2RPL9_9BACT|nr:endonuclease [[Mycoplasma] gypis]MBN0919516.1 endonuclease [[Mycoplasma] gypis]
MKKYLIWKFLLFVGFTSTISLPFIAASCKTTETDNIAKFSDNKFETNFTKNHLMEYYSLLNNKSGDDLLKALLKTQHNNAQKIPVAQYNKNVKAKDLNLAYLDKFFEKDKNTIVDIYSENPTGTDPYNFSKNDRMGSGKREGETYNREHVVPKSWYGYTKQQILNIASDMQAIWPTDSKVNSERGNMPYGEVVSVDETFQNGSRIGKDKNGNRVFEPIDAFKGDVARVYFYFAVTYSDKLKNLADGSKVFEKENVYPYLKSDYLELMIKWSKMDPIDDFELYKNNTIWNIKHWTRNPFIDFPNLYKILKNKDSVRFKK